MAIVFSKNRNTVPGTETPHFDLTFTDGTTYNLDELVKEKSRTNTDAELFLRVINDKEISKQILDELISTFRTTISEVISDSDVQKQVSKLIQETASQYGLVTLEEVPPEIRLLLNRKVNNFLKSIYDAYGVTYKVLSFDATVGAQLEYEFSDTVSMNKLVQEKLNLYLNRYKNELNNVEEGSLNLTDVGKRKTVGNEDYKKYLLGEEFGREKSTQGYTPKVTGRRPVIVWENGTEDTSGDGEDAIDVYQAIKDLNDAIKDNPGYSDDILDQTYLRIDNLKNMLKTINNESLVGTGNITISTEGSSGSSSSEPSGNSGLSETEVNGLINTAISTYNAGLTVRLAQKQPLINASNRLSANYINYNGTGYVPVTAQEKALWNSMSQNSGSGSSSGSSEVTPVILDTEMSDTSHNAVENRIIKQYVDDQVQIVSKEQEIKTHDYFYVNDVVTSPVGEVVTLEAGLTYRLTGYLNGHIVINCSTIEPSEKTILILDNVYIKSNADQAILYNCESSKLVITLPEKTSNFLVREIAAPLETSNNALLQSYNNLEINGAGYLTLRTNARTHGIKADEITIGGKPIITMDLAYGCDEGVYGHDGIHASKSLEIHNGKFDIKRANDAIGTGNNITGLNIYAGSFTLDYKAGEMAVDVKSGVRGKIYNTEFLTWNSSYALNNADLIDFNNLEAGSVSILRNGVETPLTLASNGYYQLNSTNGIYVVRGLVTSPLTVPNSTTHVDIELDNAAIIIPDGDAESAIIYNNDDSSRVSITSREGTVNYIKSCKATNGAILSNNNLEIGGKGFLYVVSGNNKAVAGSEVSIKGDGCKYFYTTGDCDIEGSVVAVGAEYNNKGTNPVYVSDDTGNANQDIYFSRGVNARASSKGKKGYVIIYTNQSGEVYCPDMTFENASQAIPPSGIYNHSSESGLVHSGNLVIANYDYTYIRSVSELIETVSEIESRISALENKIPGSESGSSGTTPVGTGLPEYPELEEGETAVLSVSMVNGQYVLSWLKTVKKTTSGIEGVSIEDSDGNPINIIAYDDNGNELNGIIYDEN